MYYAAVNSYATSTSRGFANTWSVVGFATKSMRDAYVARATDMATEAITSKEVGKYGRKLGKISYYDATGRYHDYMGHGEFFASTHTIDPTTAKLLTDGTWTHG